MLSSPQLSALPSSNTATIGGTCAVAISRFSKISGRLISASSPQPAAQFATSAMTLQPDGRIVLAGRSMRSTESPIVEFAATRLLNASGPDDRIFGDGFDGLAP